MLALIINFLDQIVPEVIEYFYLIGKIKTLLLFLRLFTDTYSNGKFDTNKLKKLICKNKKYTLLFLKIITSLF